MLPQRRIASGAGGRGLPAQTVCDSGPHAARARAALARRVTSCCLPRRRRHQRPDRVRRKLPDAADDNCRAFVAAWNRGDWTGHEPVRRPPGARFSVAGPGLTAGLGATRATHTLGTVTRKGSTATAPVTSRLRPARHRHLECRHHAQSNRTAPDIGLSSGRRPRSIPASRPGSDWSSPRPGRPGPRFSGIGGAPLTVQGPMVVVGIEGSRIKDQARVDRCAHGCRRHRGARSSRPWRRRPHIPTYFEPVFTLTRGPL